MLLKICVGNKTYHCFNKKNYTKFAQNSHKWHAEFAHYGTDIFDTKFWQNWIMLDQPSMPFTEADLLVFYNNYVTAGWLFLKKCCSPNIKMAKK